MIALNNRASAKSSIPSLLRAAAIAVVLCLPGVVSAATVNTIGLSGNFNQYSFGASGSSYYAQSVQADDTNWADLSFGISDTQGGTFDLIIATGRASGSVGGSGYVPDAGAILSQQTLNHQGGGLAFFNIMPGVTVDVGSTYFFVLQGFGHTLGAASVRATQYAGTDKYLPGEFIYSNAQAGFSNGLGWTSRAGASQDLAFRATFNSDVSQVPLPATLPLVAAGLMVLGFAGIGRKRQVA